MASSTPTGRMPVMFIAIHCANTVSVPPEAAVLNTYAVVNVVPPPFAAVLHPIKK
jgi:hypothetical protein